MHRDIAHHHPRVLRRWGEWVWVCECGGASHRVGTTHVGWRAAVVGALAHSASLAA
ncbi:hypothetical protein [Knoellia koreensis]|uniref:Uncharacterized protein n=1 Tax=Knoellia koreensis TaxID=2730921 RepID=A0A849HJS2_9MICO|nr:hypothetical protein [Knoellia sp. DB2414S]NNM44907.1 hypothetical protein [Knoellia sp. DB2414S]